MTVNKNPILEIAFHTIYTEVNTEYVYKNCALLKEIDEYLSKYRFKRVAIKMCRNFGWGGDTPTQHAFTTWLFCGLPPIPMKIKIKLFVTQMFGLVQNWLIMI